MFGPLIDTLYLSYIGQEVFLKANKRYSAAIAADTGVLQGDPLSPLLFTLYIAELALDDANDPLLHATPSHTLP